MCGSGTTLIEAVLNGRIGYGADIDPLARLITNVATTKISDAKLDYLIDDWLLQVLEVKTSVNPEDYDLDSVPNHKIWFRDIILASIFYIRDKISGIKDRDLKDISSVALSSIIKEVSNADPRDVMPEINHEKPVNRESDVFKSFEESLKTTIEKVREFRRRANEYPHTYTKIIGEDAKNLDLEDDSIDLIVTSPPYAYAMDYGRIHKLSFFTLLGMTAEQLRELSVKYVGTDRVSTKTEINDSEKIKFAKPFIEKLAQKDKRRALALHKYLLDMRDITAECERVLKPGRFFVYVIGNSTLAKATFSTGIGLKKIGESLGLHTELTYERPYYMRRMGSKRAKHSAVTKSDVFVIFRKVS